jgi:hypothetical protein
MPFPYTYSFESITASISGPNGNFAIGQGAGVDDGGISVEMAEAKNTRTTGADGLWMHALHAGKSGKIVVRLLKNSPTNSALNAMYNADTNNPAAHGQNTITINSLIAGDVITGIGCAFAQQPTITYAKEGPMLEWSWDVGRIEEILGSGINVAV